MAGSSDGPELLERHAGREVRGGGREDVAAVEGGRHRLQHVAGLRELDCLRHPAEPVRGHQQQAVVRPDVQAAVTAAQGERAAIAADSRVDDREVHADRHERQRVGQDEGSLEHVLREDAVRDVDHVGVRRDPLDDAVADADELVRDAIVGEQGYDRPRCG